MAETNEIYGEYRLYETDQEVVVIPAGDGAHGSLKIDRTEPLKLTIVSESTPPPQQSGRTRHASTIYGIFGFIQFSETDVRMIVISSKKLIGGCPLPLFKITSTQLIRLGSISKDTILKEETYDIREFERLTKKVLSVPSFFYSNDWDCTLCSQPRSKLLLSSPAAIRSTPYWQRADHRFFWNNNLLKPLIDLGEIAKKWVLPVFQGHADVHSETINGESVRLCIVSRRSKNRVGLRLFMRGIDTSGNVANFVETEQIVINGDKLASFIQVRGSIPVHWSQLPDIRYKPPPTISARHETNLSSCKTHFKELNEKYGSPTICLSLIDQKGKELVLANEYASCAEQLKPNVIFVPFDFHKECKKGKTEKLSALLDRMEPEIQHQGYFYSIGAVEQTIQNGVCRGNCVDCLDRTNVAQSLLAKRILNTQLQHMGIFKPQSKLETIVDSHKQLNLLFKCMWADNGDVVSVQYSGTSALKRDITRTGKRTIRGLADDGMNACTRYYKNNFSDGDMQDGYNLLLGHFVPQSGKHNINHRSAFASGANKTLWSVILFAIVLLFVALSKFRDSIRSSDYSSAVAVFAVAIIVIATISMVIKSHGRSLVNNPRLSFDQNSAVTIAIGKKSQ